MLGIVHNIISRKLFSVRTVSSLSTSDIIKNELIFYRYKNDRATRNGTIKRNH